MKSDVTKLHPRQFHQRKTIPLCSGGSDQRQEGMFVIPLDVTQAIDTPLRSSIDRNALL